VIIGTDKRLFADGAIPAALEPVSLSTTKGGTIVGVLLQAVDAPLDDVALLAGLAAEGRWPAARLPRRNR
jgi:hypothetical protein